MGGACVWERRAWISRRKIYGYVPSYPSVRVVRILMKSYPAGERLYVLEALSQTLLAPLNNILVRKGKENRKSKGKKSRQGRLKKMWVKKKKNKIKKILCAR